MDTFTGLLGGGGIPDCAVTGLGVVEEQAPSAFGCNVKSENPSEKQVRLLFYVHIAGKLDPASQIMDHGYGHHGKCREKNGLIVVATRELAVESAQSNSTGLPPGSRICGFQGSRWCRQPSTHHPSPITQHRNKVSSTPIAQLRLSRQSAIRTLVHRKRPNAWTTWPRVSS